MYHLHSSRLPELNKILTLNGAMTPEESSKLIDQLVREFDKNHDGKFDYSGMPTAQLRPIWPVLNISDSFALYSDALSFVSSHSCIDCFLKFIFRGWVDNPIRMPFYFFMSFSLYLN